MTILLEGVRALKGLCEIKKKTLHMLHKCNSSPAGHFIHSIIEQGEIIYCVNYFASLI
jgi:hypothetical protein